MAVATKDKIVSLAKERGVTMTALSEAFGCTRQNFYYRLGRDKWTIEELKRCAEALGCEVEIVFTDKETKQRV